MLLGMTANHLERRRRALGAFFLTFYVAPTLTLHPTSSSRKSRRGVPREARGRPLSPPFDSEKSGELGAF